MPSPRAPHVMTPSRFQPKPLGSTAPLYSADSVTGFTEERSTEYQLQLYVSNVQCTHLRPVAGANERRGGDSVDSGD